VPLLCLCFSLSCLCLSCVCLTFTFTMNTISSLTLDSHAICNPQRSISLRQVRPTTRNVVVCSAKPVAPPPTKLAAADTSGGRIGELSQVSGVLGCQWGDEGKGKLVDILAQHFEIVARCQVLPKFSSFSLFASFPFFQIVGRSESRLN